MASEDQMEDLDKAFPPPDGGKEEIERLQKELESLSNRADMAETLNEDPLPIYLEACEIQRKQKALREQAARFGK